MHDPKTARTRRLPRGGRLLVLALAGLALAGGAAYATTTKLLGKKTIEACVNGHGGVRILRPVGADGACDTSSETPLSWGQTGPKGDTGPTGATGETGPSDGGMNESVFSPDLSSENGGETDLGRISGLPAGTYLVSGVVRFTGAVTGTLKVYCGVSGTLDVGASINATQTGFTAGVTTEHAIMATVTLDSPGAIFVDCFQLGGTGSVGGDVALQAIKVGTLH